MRVAGQPGVVVGVRAGTWQRSKGRGTETRAGNESGIGWGEALRKG